MPVAIFINENGKFNYHEEVVPNSHGWWNAVETADLNGDGIMDIIAGNHGLNSRFRANTEKPLVMYVKDFDRNGLTDQVLCQYEGDQLYPLALKHDLESQIPYIGRKYQLYADYKDQQITDIFSPEELEESLILKTYELANSVYLNNGDLTFTKIQLPVQAQFSSTYAISVEDYNGDQHPDILMGGNMYHAKPEMGRYDASYGVLLLGDGSGNFTLMPVKESGLNLEKAVRGIETIESPFGTRVMVVNNNDSHQLFMESPQN